jgi:hypothetical protein
VKFVKPLAEATWGVEVECIETSFSSSVDHWRAPYLSEEGSSGIASCNAVASIDKKLVPVGVVDRLGRILGARKEADGSGADVRAPEVPVRRGHVVRAGDLGELVNGTQITLNEERGILLLVVR